MCKTNVLGENSPSGNFVRGRPNILADAVRSRWPEGVCGDREKCGAPIVTKATAVNRAREIELASGSPREHGRTDVLEGCVQTSDVAGDGTTTAPVLAQAILP